MVWDKTGTLTAGAPVVAAVHTAQNAPTALSPSRSGLPRDALLELVAAAEEGSAHPIAKAIVAERDGRNGARLQVEAGTVAQVCMLRMGF